MIIEAKYEYDDMLIRESVTVTGLILMIVFRRTYYKGEGKLRIKSITFYFKKKSVI